MKYAGVYSRNVRAWISSLHRGYEKEDYREDDDVVREKGMNESMK
jgi:hypothetical protein